VSIYNESTVPCYQNVPRATRRKGYIVMVAVMPEMNRFHTIKYGIKYLSISHTELFVYLYFCLYFCLSARPPETKC